ncbi:MAG: CHAP domain-containing protein [Oscillospiraceae bacterium]|nr:CHAP domain-containing protein [Oscillospiraceae bacterium]
MSKKTQNGGFTLMELLCAIAVASVITLAATSVLLLGMKINRQSADTVKTQTNTRILLSAFEDMSASGAVKEIHVEPDSWVIRNEEGRPMMTYLDGVIATGGGVTVMEDVVDSNVELENNLLTYMVETADGVYKSSVYCRSVVVDNPSTGLGEAILNQDITFESVPEGRTKFLDILSTQLGSQGEIMEYDPDLEKYVSSESYYSLWYVGGKDYPLGWNEDTPWCGCYVAWAIDQCADYLDYPDENEDGKKELPLYANVDWFRDDFILRRAYTTFDEMNESARNHPAAGDIIFFDWHVDNVKDPEHVGVVINCATDTNDGITYIYTIEGNNGDKVVLCRYNITNPQILGYGQLNWLSDPQESK